MHTTPSNAAGGIYEDIDDGFPAGAPPSRYHGVLNYTASASNALWAAKLLQAHQRGERVGWGWSAS